MRKLILMSAFLSGATLISCGTKDKQSTAQQQERKIVVSLYQVRSEDVALEYSTKGFFEGERDLLLRPQVSGRIVSVLVDEGAFVKAGQVLLRLDPSDYENILRQLEAQLSQARANYENTKAVAERRKLLIERELIAREEFDNIQTQLRSQEELIKSLQAQLENARLNLQRTTLTAPFSGFVAQKFINVGDYITPQSQTFRLVTLDPIRFTFQIPQEYLPYAKVGSKINLRVEPFGEYVADVFFVSPTADSNRLITVKARLSNQKGDLRPGMYGEVRLTTSTEKAFVLPERAVIIQGTRKVVWRIQDNTAQPVEVQVIKQGHGLVYVKGQLQDGDRIALDNAYSLRQGMKVEVR